MSDTFDPKVLNLTELVMICQAVNQEAHRGLPRALLEQMSLGNDVELPERFTTKMRLKIMKYIDGHWDYVEYQLSCPAKSRNPYACFECSDLQVASCTLENPTQLLREG